MGALDHRSNQQNVKLDSGEDVWLSIGNLLDTHEAQLLTEYDRYDTVVIVDLQLMGGLSQFNHRAPNVPTSETS